MLHSRGLPYLHFRHSVEIIRGKFDANSGDEGQAVYQTGHGGANDLAGTDRANPVGQILALASLLEESFDLDYMAAAVREATNAVLAAGWRTADVMAVECTEVGTRELGKRIADRAQALIAAHRTGT